MAGRRNIGRRAAGDDLRLDLASQARLLAPVRGLVRTYLLSEGFSSDKAEEVVLAVDEACTNAIRHSYDGDPGQRLILSVRKRDGAVEFELSDEGKPIEPDRCRRRDLDRPDPATLAPGGLGVQFMYRVFDEVTFRPGRERGNRVIMRLNRQK